MVNFHTSNMINSPSSHDASSCTQNTYPTFSFRCVMSDTVGRKAEACASQQKQQLTTEAPPPAISAAVVAGLVPPGSFMPVPDGLQYQLLSLSSLYFPFNNPCSSYCHSFTSRLTMRHNSVGSLFMSTDDKGLP